ncbi:ferredoxin:protochlorophyllide reductase (ATP-dependent) subunit B [Chloracidobacterium sp. MS 40/45]|uniref:ferredoxin:protochlorophyllide reductase (ATP-dependent) subunit B n=1 Tax=Chloracidobacterium aggregatum TaxID=2851959 RepID=UPI001B8D53B3|nr:ferredoxin:protochlorophyllide reductase (ATP-dependent) subunit B [Chloracidobacterium aggregatum]QUW00859.1 ferredoxin:protochlorophyllide reductase (ATP-dependent) subunit B [Chloracidobacterium sp. MS 40/45]
MRLHYWTYEGPAHVGACRVGTSIPGVHTVLHAPGGDSYTSVLFTMIDRQCGFPSVTNVSYGRKEVSTTGVDRMMTVVEQVERTHKPRVIQVIPTCTSNLLREDVGGALNRLQTTCDAKLLFLQLNAFCEKEDQGADMTFAGLVEHLATGTGERTPEPTANILGLTSLGFRHRDDLREITQLLNQCGVRVNAALPFGGTAADFQRLGQAWFNVVPYAEIGLRAAKVLENRFGQPYLVHAPIGIQATQEFIELVQARVEELGGRPARFQPRPEMMSRVPWYSRSADSHYLTPKRSFVFGVASHALAVARMMEEEIGMRPLAVGTFSYEHAPAFLDECTRRGWNGFYSDDFKEVERRIADAMPDIVLGTQMERHSARRHQLPATVISCPAHVTDFPARYSPFAGWEGANVIFDAVTHTLTLGLESHLIDMFRELPGIEHDSVLGAVRLPDLPPSPSPMSRDEGIPAEPRTEQRGATSAMASTPAAVSTPAAAAVVTPPATEAPGGEWSGEPRWTDEALAELKKIPFFVRKKAMHNTEKYAREHGLREILPQTIHATRDELSRK